MLLIRSHLICCRMPSLRKYLRKKAFPFEYFGGVVVERERKEEMTGVQHSEKQPN